MGFGKAAYGLRGSFRSLEERTQKESKAVLRLQGSHGATVSTEPVDDEGDGPTNLAQQPGDEELEVLGREIVVEDVEQQPQAASLRGDAESRDDRGPVGRWIVGGATDRAG